MWIKLEENHPNPYFRILDEIRALALVEQFNHHPAQTAEKLKGIIEKHLKQEGDAWENEMRTKVIQEIQTKLKDKVCWEDSSRSYVYIRHEVDEILQSLLPKQEGEE